MGSTFVWSSYSRTWGLPWTVGHIPSGTPLEKQVWLFPSRYQLQIASWEGVGFYVHLSQLPFNFVPVEEEKCPSRGLGANSASSQGSITCAKCGPVTCWLGIRKSSSHETGLSISLSVSSLLQNRKWPLSGRISQGKLLAHWMTPSK